MKLITLAFAPIILQAFHVVIASAFVGARVAIF